MQSSDRLTPVLLIVLLYFMALPTIVAAEPASRATRVFGEGSALGNGMVWTWVEYDAKKAPTALGFTFTETAISALSPEPPAPGLENWEYALALPRGAMVPPYTHLVLNWNPYGHVPPGVYDVPHFDFHFYIIDPEQREKISCKGADLKKCMNKPAADFISSAYILPPGTEMPRMGVHWIDPAAPEFNRQPFTHTFIYGSYDRQVAFLETMITRAFLESKPSVTTTIKPPAKFQKHGYYPTVYSVKYDPERREYSVAFEGLVQK
ncbi:MAG TPA: hypothetical protein VFK88_01120 [Gallionella sp.]|nr:hypothetical protein [Gallionella sp.]